MTLIAKYRRSLHTGSLARFVGYAHAAAMIVAMLWVLAIAAWLIGGAGNGGLGFVLVFVGGAITGLAFVIYGAVKLVFSPIEVAPRG